MRLIGPLIEIGHGINLVRPSAASASPLAVEGAPGRRFARHSDAHGSLDDRGTLLEARLGLRRADDETLLASISESGLVAWRDTWMTALAHGIQGRRAPGHQSVAQVGMHVHVVRLAAATELPYIPSRRLLGYGGRDGVHELHGPATKVHHAYGLVVRLTELSEEVVDGDPAKGTLVNSVHYAHALLIHCKWRLLLQELLDSLQQAICLLCRQHSQACGGAKGELRLASQLHRHPRNCLFKKRL
mmetsp:Transcript_13525/g.49213  ORF Transcript_13525/g.49213 Transcript_13525/m.49213 type:complete len:244 (-) Transcript_13525:612-1343(-)